MTIILKATSKGQVTLPAKWRKKFNTSQFLATIKDNSIEIEPLNIQSCLKPDEYTVFDAIRDNEGKGIKAKDLLKSIKNTL